MVSPDGACKSFDASANGYARAEGVAVVVLKRAGLAGVPWAAPREPYAQIVGCDTNNDGFTEKGITFPSGDAQSELGTKARAPAMHMARMPAYAHARYGMQAPCQCDQREPATRAALQHAETHLESLHRTPSAHAFRRQYISSGAHDAHSPACSGGCAQGRLPTS